MNSNNPSRSKKSRKPAGTFANIGSTEWFVVAVVGLVTFVVFMPGLWNEFVNWDDYETLADNPRYRGLGWTQLRWMFTTFHMGHYQPLSWLTFSFDYLIWGTNPFGYHLTNILLHAGNAALFFLLSRLLLSHAFYPSKDAARIDVDLAAAVAALLFSLHPLRVESVVWATERRDVLSGLFFLLTLYCYVRAQENTGPSSHRSWLAASLVACVFSLTAKATAITMPAVLLLLDVYPLRRLQGGWRSWLEPNGKRILWEKVPFAVLAIVFAIIAAYAQQSAGALRPMQQYFLSYRLGQAAYGTIFYLWKSLVPWNLSPLYELPYDFEAWMPLLIFSAAVAAAITIALFLLRRQWPAALASWLYYLVMLMPVLGIAQSGPQLVADRYSYFSCMSWAVLLGGGFFHLCNFARYRSEDRSALFGISALASPVLIIFAIMTLKQTEVWRNTKTLWEYVIAAEPQSSIAHYNLGRIYENDGRLDDGIKYYRRAVTINPTNADAHYNLARLLAKQDMQAQAIDHYSRALAVRPNDADAHNNLGLLLARRGEFEPALAEFKKAIHFDPKYGKAFFNMGRIFAQRNELDKAVENYRQALTLNPNEIEILLGLGDALVRQGQAAEAEAYLQRAVTLRPESSEAHVALARSLASQGKKDEAEKYYREALRLLKSKSQAARSDSGAPQ
jgi:tetratricopeptide (TPR) repeat protein